MRAVVLLSGGIDSATALYYAKAKAHSAYCLTFDYGQRHRREIIAARRIAQKSRSRWLLLKISLPWKGSALLDKRAKLPVGMIGRVKIPSSYVPARNIIFLSYAVSYAETIRAKAIYIGANQLDYSGYPDCRKGFIDSFSAAVHKGTKSGVEGQGIRIEAPLIRKSKGDIIRIGNRLHVPFELTWSCYKGKMRPCGRCDSCLIRAKGFTEAGLKDPLL